MNIIATIALCLLAVYLAHIGLETVVTAHLQYGGKW